MSRFFRWDIVLGALIALITIEACCVWWQYRRAIIVVVNQSGKDISDLKIEMREGALDLGPLRAGTKTSARVFPKGESSFVVSFKTPEGRAISSGGGYIESTGGYRYTMTVAPDWQVASQPSLARGCIILPILKCLRPRPK